MKPRSASDLHVGLCMPPLVTFVRAFPRLWETTRHLSWPMKLKFWSASLAHYRMEHVSRQHWLKRTRLGDPSRRSECCDLRPQQYPDHQDLSAVSDLAPLVKPAGVGWGGYIQFFDCSLCGQPWMQDWEPDSRGGTYRVKKV